MSSAVKGGVGRNGVADSGVAGDKLQFHPYTGNPLTKKEDSRYEDTQTGQSYFANPKPTVGIIIPNARNQILLAKRGVEPFIHTWDLPGGFVEIGESFEEAAVREIKEELGVTVQTLQYVSSQVGTYEYAGIMFPILDTTFVAILANDAKSTGDVYSVSSFSPADDVSEVAFFDVTAIPFAEIKMENIVQALQTYIRTIDIKDTNT